MRITFFLLAALMVSITGKAEEPMWLVSVYGENMQLISGASSTADVTDGEFLSTDFVGTEIYVRAQEGYELDGFRPYKAPSGAATVSSVTESADAMIGAAEPAEKPMDEFGPLADSGLLYSLDYNYVGWECSAMYVQPMGDRVYRLRCDETMKHMN